MNFTTNYVFNDFVVFLIEKVYKHDNVINNLMLIKINISYDEQRNYNTNWNFKILTMKELSIDENDFRIDIYTNEFWFNIREKNDFDFRVISIAIIVEFIEIVINVE